MKENGLDLNIADLWQMSPLPWAYDHLSYNLSFNYWSNLNETHLDLEIILMVK